jgi:Rieske Fe-S protein
MTTGSSSASAPTSETPLSRAARLEGARGCDRRGFLGAACSGAIGCAAAALAGSGALGALGAAGCTSPPRTYRPRSGEPASIPLERYPELRSPGGLVKALHPSLGALFVRRADPADPERYEALSALCTHTGCVIAPSGGGFTCPCHGSSFDREGAVTSGPANEPLPRFLALREGDRIVVSAPPSPPRRK